MSATSAQATRPFYVILSPTLVPKDPVVQMVYLPWRKALDPYWTTTSVSSTLCWVKALRLWDLPPEHSLLWLIQGMPGQSGEVPGSTQHEFIYRIANLLDKDSCATIIMNVSLSHRKEELSWGWQVIGFADFYTDAAPRSMLVRHGGGQREWQAGCQILFIWSSKSHFCFSCPVLYKIIALAPLPSGFWLDEGNGRGLQKVRGREGGKWSAPSLPDHELGSGYILLHPNVSPFPH